VKRLKLYSKQKPVKINGINPLFAETYTLDINGTRSDSVWYSELETDDYETVRLELEKNGYTAHPASSKEIESREYSIFKG
jgi:hypothetical protein